MDGRANNEGPGEPLDPDQDQTLPLRAEIASVTGRRAKGGQRGLPAIEQFSFQTPDGTTHDFGAPDLGQRGTLQVVSAIAGGIFQRDGAPFCPICIDGAATDEEHVPQENLGGRVMTMTCKACNNLLGSRVEAALQDWFDHAYGHVTFEHDGDVRGRRRIPRTYYRQASNGSFALVVDGELAPEIKQMLASGQFTMSSSAPDAMRWRIALLKHAYLAACLYLRAAPNTEQSRTIRADLIAARDATTATQLPDSEAAKRLNVYRSQVGRQGPPLALVAKHNPESDAEPETLISLAGVLFVTWPLSDLLPGTWRPISEDGE